MWRFMSCVKDWAQDIFILVPKVCVNECLDVC